MGRKEHFKVVKAGTRLLGLEEKRQQMLPKSAKEDSRVTEFGVKAEAAPASARKAALLEAVSERAAKENEHAAELLTRRRQQMEEERRAAEEVEAKLETEGDEKLEQA